MPEKAPSSRVSRVDFGVFTTDEIVKLSVKEVTNPLIFDSMGHATTGGLYDRALGPSERDDVCITCGLNQVLCPGHIGHIALPLTVYNPVFFRQLFAILKASCFKCKRLLVRTARSHFLVKCLELLDHGLASAIEGLEDVYHSAFCIASTDVKESAEEKVAVSFNEEQVMEALDTYVARAVADAATADGEMPHDEPLLRHGVSLRRNLIAEVQTCQFRREPSRCGQCSFPVRKMRAEGYCKIFFGQGISMRRLQSSLKKKAENEDDREAIVEDELADYDEKEASENPKARSKPKRSEETDDDVTASLMQQEYLTPSSAKEHMRALWQSEGKTLSVVFGMLTKAQADGTQPYPTDVFFMDVVAVPPTRFRPTMHLKGMQYANPQTATLNKVLASSVAIRSILRDMRDKEQHSAAQPTPGRKADDVKVQRGSDKERLHAAWIGLQVNVNSLYDSQLDRLGKDQNPGVKQILEKKEGLFRKHMMGKRVDYAARSVISPDPYIGVDEIGIPMVFAKKLTYPEPVTTFNADELRQAVLNGPDVHPGATHVETDSGKKILLSATDRTQREALSKSLLTQAASVDQLLTQPKKVHRHLRTGDVLLLNRQPTLHKPSIQAHRARVLPGEKTLRLHYACCKAYNADFDGDEMNAHFPQNEFGRSEAYNIMSVRNQYLVPKDGTPLAGLIQDHMVSGVWLTIRGRFFSRYDYQQLVYSALIDFSSAVKLLPPSIIKPQMLWSGKQVLSTVLLNIIPKSKLPLNLHGKAKISSKIWQTDTVAQADYKFMCESEVIIRQGELLCGVLDKNHYGSTPYSLVHCCYELYGGETASRTLTCFAKLFTAFLPYRGFSLGIEDILVTKEADRKRRQVMRQGRKSGFTAVASVFGSTSADEATEDDSSLSVDEVTGRYRAAQFAADDADMRAIERAMKRSTDEIQNQITKVCMPTGLLKKFPENNLQLMVISGAKGSAVNCMQISCLLGQMELEGRRPPLMLSGRTLPSFLPYDPSPRAGGFIDARFLTGLRPQEYFFHCMAGREGLVDTAVKTSRSGYLQRCIIKHLEGLMVSYDLTVRDSDSSVIQFQYGEDGIEIGKTPFLNEKQFPFLIENQRIVLRDDELEQVCSSMDQKRAAKHIRKVTRWQKKARPCGSRRAYPFLLYSKNQPTNAAVQPIADGYRAADAQKIISAYRNLVDEDELSRLAERCKAVMPVMSALNPNRYFGSIPEKLSNIITSYTQRNPEQLIVADEEEVAAATVTRISAGRFRTLLNLRCLRALAEPGEAVGLLAAQSIGEPSTQMTLNTFHFAGRGDMNVTLGIPRLREVLMVASANIRTPTMEIPLCNPSSKRVRKRAEALQRRLCRVTLKEVIESVQIWETLDVICESAKRCRSFKMRFSFLPQHQYSDRCGLTSRKVLHYFESVFIGVLLEAIKKAIFATQSLGLTSTAKVATRRRRDAKNDDGKAPNDATAASEADAEAAAGDDDEDDDADDQHDGDATSARAREKHTEERDYDGEDEEKRALAMEEDGAEDDDVDEGVGSGNEAEEAAAASSGDEDVATGKLGESKKPGVTWSIVVDTQPQRLEQSAVEIKMDSARVNAVTQKYGVPHYAYDAEKEEWAEITFKFPLLGSKIDAGSVVQSVSRAAVVSHVVGIRRAFLSSPAGGDSREQALSLHTDGVNIAEILKYDDTLDLNRLYTNDIQAVLRHYGVEAAARVIIKECRDVFAMYGIDVDYRHLSLIADYMTYDGTYKPFNRIGIEANPSPLQKMSFETTMHFLRAATMEGAADDLDSPSSRLVTGRIVKCGTGCFEVLHDPQLSKAMVTQNVSKVSRR